MKRILIITVFIFLATGLYAQQKGNANNVSPQKYTLSQNYPNPFNPSTKIKFDLPYNIRIKLTIFDLLGRNIITLKDEVMNAGVHEITFDASNLPGGVYFYKLSAPDGFSEMKRMILLK